MRTIYAYIVLLLLLMVTSCQQRERLAEGNAVYYWRTDFRLDSTERSFLSQYHINKVYCRYFDVVLNEVGELVPNATIKFSSTLPEGVEMIPTVYITEDCKKYRLIAIILPKADKNIISS